MSDRGVAGDGEAEPARLSHETVLNAGPAAINLWRARNPGAPLNARHAVLDGLNLSGADLSSSDLSGVSFRGANLTEVDLSFSNVCDGNFSECLLTAANLKGAKVSGAEFSRALIGGANLTLCVGLSRCKHLLSCRLSPGEDVQGLDDLPFRALDKISWGVLRKIGRLRLFVPSYFALTTVLVYFQILGYYDTVAYEIRKFLDKGEIPQPMGAALSRLLLAFAPEGPTFRSLLVLLSTLSLAVGASLYTFFCPASVQEFTLEQWEHALGRSRFYYVVAGWQSPFARVACALAFLVGGGSGLYLIAYNVTRYTAFLLKKLALSG
jgi:hypothetical protein